MPCRSGFVPALLVAAAWAAPAVPVVAADPPAASKRPGPPSLLDVVKPEFRDAVAQVIRQPTMTVKAADDEFVADPKVYDWLVEHPDRTVSAWRRLNVPCVEIADAGGGKFRYADDQGSELTWQTVGTFEHGVVWYATGKIKAGALLPMVPVKTVSVLYAPRTATGKADGSAAFQPLVYVYVFTDSRAAAAVLRVVGPAAPKLAEQAAEQLLLFFSGPARYLHKHPDEVPTLLAPGKVANPPADR